MTGPDARSEAEKRAARGVRLYFVFMEPRESTADRSALRGEHLRFLQDLQAQGRLFASGPLVDDTTGESLGRAVSIMRGESAAEVEAIMREEPFVRHGLRTFTVVAWRFADGDALAQELSTKPM